LDAVEGGFAIDGRQTRNRRIIAKVQAACNQSLNSLSLADEEVALETSDSSLVLSSAGASGIVRLPSVPSTYLESTGEVLRPDPNTNLMTPRTLLPTIKHSGPSWPNEELVMITAVFGISYKAGKKIPLAELEERWFRRPKVMCNPESGLALS
jgi:hypothetical protein